LNVLHTQRGDSNRRKLGFRGVNLIRRFLQLTAVNIIPEEFSHSAFQSFIAIPAMLGNDLFGIFHID
jgi:hypothetical protein